LSELSREEDSEPEEELEDRALNISDTTDSVTGCDHSTHAG